MPMRSRKSTPPAPTPPKAPPAAFIAEHALQARFSAALALVAQAVTLFDEVRGSGDPKALEAEGRLGDGHLIGDAWDAGEDLRDELARWSRSLKRDGYAAVREEVLANFRDAIADTDDGSIEHHLKVAAALEAEWALPSPAARQRAEGEAANAPAPLQEDRPLAGMVKAWRFYARSASVADQAFERADRDLERAYRDLGFDDEQSCRFGVDEPLIQAVQKAKEAGDDRLIAAIVTSGYLRPEGATCEPSLSDRLADGEEFAAFADAAEAGRLADAALEHLAGFPDAFVKQCWPPGRVATD